MSDNHTTLLLIRHGQTEWNAAGRIQGQTNSNLTRAGQSQAQAAADWLAADPAFVQSWSKRPTAIYTSDLTRTVQTTKPIAKALGVTEILEPALREMHFGELEGLSWSQAERKFPRLSQQIWHEPIEPEVVIPGGESRQQMHDRSFGAIRRIAKQHPGETVAIISHGGVIGYFLRRTLHIPFTVAPPFATPNGSIAVVGFADEQFRVRALGLLPATKGLLSA